MKKTVFYPLFALLAVSTLAAAVTETPDPKTPIQVQLKNAGFENGTADWCQYGSVPPGQEKLAFSTVADAATGKRALQIRDEWTDARPYAIQFFELPAVQGRRLTVNCMVKAPAGHVFSFGAQCLDKTHFLTAKLVSATGTGTWQKYTAVLTDIPESACRFTVALGATPYGNKAAGTVLFDDVSVLADLDPLDVTPVPAVKEKLAGKQIELCMVGDSITWAGKGDYFRAFLLKEMPNLAFVGTHTAMLGYSHAGEGGDNTASCLKTRIDDRSAIPDSRYYHILMGVNDSAGSKSREAAPDNARRIADRLMTMVQKLLARPGTEKVFLGTIFPCYPDAANPDEALLKRYELRDFTASLVNEILRKEAVQKCGKKLILVEYEKPLRAREDWKKVIRLHPTVYGYSVVAPILAKVLKKETLPANGPQGEYGIEIVNLWDEAKQETQRLIPGFYLVSFTAEDVKHRHVTFEFYGDGTGLRKNQQPTVCKVDTSCGHRDRGCAVVFIRDARQVCRIRNANCTLSRIVVEKMRPAAKWPTAYQTGRFVDPKAWAMEGELFVPVK